MYKQDVDNVSPCSFVLFVYNRPWHTSQTLNFLALNELAKESVLYIFSDGYKDIDSKTKLKRSEAYES